MHIHLIAICGTGMASLAGLLKEKGYEVTGSDANVYPPMSDQLASLGIDVQIGYRAENIDRVKPDLVVVGNAISKGNPEVSAVQAIGLPLLSMPQAISRFFLEGEVPFRQDGTVAGDTSPFSARIPIVVAGTHGKTTTAALLAWILERAGRSPSFFVGGVLKNFGRSYQLGTGNPFVLEGDEYDTAFFDKGPKFLHYRPQMLILNAVEFDHADIYRNLDHVLESFSKLIAIMPRTGLIVADGDNANVRGLITKAPCRVVTIGLNGETDLSAVDLHFGETTRFGLVKNGQGTAPFESPLPGRHNLKNLLAVIEIALELGLTPDVIQDGLASFEGIKRRQEILAEIGGVTVIDDFAHHPTAVRETLSALRGKYGKKRIWAVFEPRSNTTRRNIFQKDFVTAFDQADEVILAAPFQPEKIPETDRLHPEAIVKELQGNGRRARYLPSVDEIVSTVAAEARPGDVLCLMSNGGFGGIYDRMIKKLREL